MTKKYRKKILIWCWEATELDDTEDRAVSYTDRSKSTTEVLEEDGPSQTGDEGRVQMDKR